MIIATVGALLNILLDFALVYGIKDVIPALHIQGAAYASVIAQVVMALLSLIYLIKKTSIRLRLSLPFNKEIRRFILMILNLFVRTVALNVALYYASAFSTSYGSKYIAAYTIAINLWFLGAFIIDGYSSAGNILSGKLYGAKAYDLLLKLGYKLIRYGFMIGVIMGIIGWILYYPIVALFTQEMEVREAFYEIFWIVLVMQPFCSLAFIFDGIFKGLGKMKFLRNVLLFATFIIFVPTIFWLDGLDLKLYAVFGAITLWMVARGLPLILKFRKMFIPLAQKT